LKRLPVEKPDVVLMDINMAGMNGIECAHRTRPTVTPTVALLWRCPCEPVTKNAFAPSFICFQILTPVLARHGLNEKSQHTSRMP
jgi:CheY-like chemotaxis protein